MYLDYFKKDIENISAEITAAQTKKLQAFKDNLLSGIEYYENLITASPYFKKNKTEIQNQFNDYRTKLIAIAIP
ncbi:hypothetical protein, partial [Salmonella enterica]|uniref:hypothetical protein n=1 Tax=Salmonella enterica TaxID=28901 RepID=UPI0022B7541D